MTLTQIKYIVETVRTGSISKAAANLFVSQSVVSLSISNLEKEIGKPLFIRNNTGVTLTPFGKIFAAYLSTIQDQLDQLNTEIVRETQENDLSLSVASISFTFVSHACALLLNKYGKIGLRIDHYDENELGVVQLVSSRIAEIGFLRIWSCYRPSILNQFKSQKLQYFPIARLNISATVGKDNPLYKSGKSDVSTDDLKKYPAIVYRGIDAGPYSDILKKLNVLPIKSEFVTSSRAAINEVLNTTDAYHLDTKLPDRDYLKDYYQNSRRTLLIRDTDIYSEIGWIKSREYTPTPIANELINIITDCLSQ